MKRNWDAITHRAFQIGIVLKGIDGLLEITAGTALLLTTRPAILHAVNVLTRDELTEDPHDYFANLLVHLAKHLSLRTQHFAAFYLLGHGLVKAGLVAGLLCKVRRAYPAALVFLVGFVLYQVYRIFRHPSPGLLFLTGFDVVIIALVWLEWRRGERLSSRTA